MASIYVITNDVNGKQYVGKTLKDISERFKEHINDSKKERCEKRPLYEAIQKYGEKHFSIRALEEDVDPEILSEREIYWIKELGTYGHGGYNMTHGGEGRPLYDYEQIKELALQGLFNTEIAAMVGCCTNTVVAVRKLYGLIGGNDILKKPIDQLSMCGDLIRTFDSMTDAVKWLIKNHYTNSNMASFNIRNCALGKKSSIYGFKWRYHNESDRPSH